MSGRRALAGLWPRRWWARLGLGLLLGPPLLILLFRFAPVPVTPLMLLRAAQGHGIEKQWVAYEEIARALPRSVIAAEDNGFCGQWLGFDFAALRGEVAALLEGERPRGASTITMQLAKNLFLWPGRDPVRKLLEAWLTPQIALLWPKRRILEVYLNIVEFGPGLYGAEAASRAFWNRGAADLTPGQAALLAVVLPLPLEWSAEAPGPYLRERAALIQRRVGQLGGALGCAG